MSVRTDITVNWYSSPRIITVAAPSVELTMQDLVDTARMLEAGINTMDDGHLVDAAGKESLGGGVLVGITVTLKNAKVAFEGRGGPTYTQCNISGGNLVALDVAEAEMSPIEATAFTQIVLANSSSATLQEMEAIQYSSYNGGVTVDITGSSVGIDYPIGTPREPVDNLTDAMSIATDRGFTTIYVVGDITIDSSGNYSGMIFVGESQTKSEFDVDPNANVSNCEFYDATVIGTLDGNSKLRNCRIAGLNYIYGVIEQCILDTGTIVLGGGATAQFLDCWSGVPGTDTPVIDMGGSGQGLSLRNYNGGVTLENKTGTDKASIDLNSGQIKLKDTVTNGTIVCRGVGKLIDFVTGDYIPSGVHNGCTIVNELITPMITELHQLQGLDSDNPVTVTPTTRVAGSISQTISGDGETNSTIQRT